MAILPTRQENETFLITPTATAVNESPPQSIADQKFLYVHTGNCRINPGVPPDPGGLESNFFAWRRETARILPSSVAALTEAVNRFRIPQPSVASIPVFDVEQSAPFVGFGWVAAVDTLPSSTSEQGFAVDKWRIESEGFPDVNGNPVLQAFGGILVDVAVISGKFLDLTYHITMVGKIRFREFN